MAADISKSIMSTEENFIQINNSYSAYNDYAIAEWKKFQAEPQRQEALLKATENIQVNSVLDIGCGAGQEMLPFVARGVKAVGIDITPEVGQIGREMFIAKGYGEKVEFIRASGENLPFAADTFDVLICRIALMYMNIKFALREIARVLRTEGLFFLKYHAPPYYWEKFSKALMSRNILSSVHAMRCLVTGNFYHMSGRQPFNKLTAAGETFVTKKILQREFKNSGLKIIGEMPDSNNQTPSLIISKGIIK
jgi:ubiquinone/menaquinone biosynthesis C-methylase UbiE